MWSRFNLAIGLDLLQQALSGVDTSLKEKGLSANVALQSALDTQFLLQIGVFTAVPMIMNFVLEEGILRVRFFYFLSIDL